MATVDVTGLTVFDYSRLTFIFGVVKQLLAYVCESVCLSQWICVLIVFHEMMMLMLLSCCHS